MRLLIISDVHSNIAALRAVTDHAGPADAVAFAGDAVDYGPRPEKCVAWLKQYARFAVRGNHDHALAFNEDCKASPPFHALSVASRAMNDRRVSGDDRAYLGRLPLEVRFKFGGSRFRMVHATPSDALYRYVPDDLSDKALVQQLGPVDDADILILGHTHRPLIRDLGSFRIVNPGSVGQPKHGDPRAAYAIWEDGVLTQRFVPYPVEETIVDLETAGLSGDITAALIAVLRTGR